MRLNLGEIAMALCCGPAQVIWQADSATGHDHAQAQYAITPLQTALEQDRASLDAFEAGPYSWEDAPWAEIVPTGAQVDSRRITPGNLFFCLSGNNADGHDFAFAAAQSGACAVIAQRNPFLGKETQAQKAALTLPPVFLVEDVKTALGRLALCHRDTSVARIIGVTGTAGKTSVKEVLAQVLAVRGRTQRNHMNFNNQIGLPISMLNASADASFWIMEIGISEAHDMDELGRILRPDLALILNVGDAHITGLAELGVAGNKALLLDYIHPGGIAVVSVDYPELSAETDKRLPEFARRAVQLLGFSANDNASTYCRARYLGPAGELTGKYQVVLNDKKFEAVAPFRGDFGSENVAAIFTAAHILGLTQEEIVWSLATAALPEQRFSSRRYDDFLLVDDSYNANPLSMGRMVKAAAAMARETQLPLILVLGEMLELGRRTESAHRDLGLLIAEARPTIMFWKGEQRNAVLQGLEEGGYAGAFYPVEGGQDFSLLLEELELNAGLALFKGSRGNHLERLVDIFREHINPAGENHAV